MGNIAKIEKKVRKTRKYSEKIETQGIGREKIEKILQYKDTIQSKYREILRKIEKRKRKLRKY